MRKLGVLLMLSAVLLVWGVVPTSTSAFGFNPGAVVLHCSGNPQPLVWAVSPVDPFGDGIDRGDDCATSIQLLLADRCTLKDVLAPANPQGSNGDEVTFIFLCVSSAVPT
jgi:hypothetical protein